MRKINYIVIHHSAVTQPDIYKLIKSMDRTHKERWLHTVKNWLWHYIAYHYIIWVDWKIIQTRLLEEVWYHASDKNVNKTSVWIMLSGNFDKDKPTKNKLIH